MVSKLWWWVHSLSCVDYVSAFTLSVSHGIWPPLFTCTDCTAQHIILTPTSLIAFNILISFPFPQLDEFHWYLKGRNAYLVSHFPFLKLETKGDRFESSVLLFPWTQCCSFNSDWQHTHFRAFPFFSGSIQWGSQRKSLTCSTFGLYQMSALLLNSSEKHQVIYPGEYMLTFSFSLHISFVLGIFGDSTILGF